MNAAIPEPCGLASSDLPADIQLQVRQPFAYYCLIAYCRKNAASQSCGELPAAAAGPLLPKRSLHNAIMM